MAEQENNRERVNVLEFRVDIVTPEKAGRWVVDLAQKPGVHQVVTLNPEQIVAGVGDERFRHVVNNADLVVADGIGLAIATSIETGGRPVPRVTGTDIILESAKWLSQNDISVFFLGGVSGIAEEALVALQKEVKENYGGYDLKGQAESGPADICALSPKDREYQEIIRRVVDSGAGLLACALSSPEGVIWIDGFLRDIERSYKLEQGIVGVVVGGVFDVLGRAPQESAGRALFSSFGLEWLYRLYREPSRLPRIFNAVVKFPLMYLRWKFSKHLHTP